MTGKPFFPIPYVDSESGLSRRYFPDYIVEDDKYVEEVKYSFNISQLVVDKYLAAYIHFKSIGIKYYIVTEKNINKHPMEVFNSELNVMLRNENGLDRE